MANDFDLSTLPRGARAEEVRKRLEASILAGDFGRGAQLPSERELVELFRVSRLSVREGIQGLIGIGLVEARHGSGYFVASDISGSYRAAFAAWLHVHGDDLIDMYQVRGALTKLAAVRALKSRDDDAVQPILAAHQALVDAVERDVGPQDIADLDIAFHNSIGQASGSPLIDSLLRELHERLNEPRHAIMSLPGQQTRSAEEHQSIVDALQAGDAGRVARAVDEHIASVCSTIREHAASCGDGTNSGDRT